MQAPFSHPSVPPTSNPPPESKSSSLALPPSNIRAIAHHPTQPWLAVAEGSQIFLMHRDTCEIIGKPMVGHTNALKSLAFNGDGSQIVSDGLDHTVRLWDTASQAALGPPMKGHHGEVLSVAFSPDGKQVVSGSEMRPCVSGM